MRKAILSVCLVYVLVLLLPLFAWTGAAPSEPAILDDYSQIPGITAAQIEAVKAIQAKYARFTLATMPQNTECFYDERGELGGVIPMLCQWLTDIFGIPFEPAFYDWPDTLAGLADHSIDFTGEITVTPEREEYLFMTDSIGERTIKVIRRSGSKKLSDSTPTDPIRCCFLKGTTAYDYVEPYVSDIIVVYADSLSDVHTLFAEDRIDAFVVDSNAESVFDGSGAFIAEDFWPVIYTPVSLATQNPDLAPIIELVQQLLNSQHGRHFSDIYERGYAEYMQHKLSMQLTPAEKDYIRQRRESSASIPFIVEFDSYPVSFYNNREQKWQGASYDILMEIGKLTGLNFVPANASDAPWVDLLPMLRSGSASMATELIHSPDRVGNYLWAEDPYLTDYYALLSLAEYADVGVHEIGSVRVGQVMESAYAEFFHECFPDHKNTIDYATVFDAVRALERGEIELLMATKNILLSITNYLEKPGFKANLVFMRAYDSYYGFNIDETILRSIVSKAQRLVDTRAITDRWQRTVYDYKKAVESARRPLTIILIALTVVVIALLGVLVIRHKRAGEVLEATVHQRTRELAVASQAKSEFLSRMSHEIRTPLNAIIGMTAIALSAQTREKSDNSIREVEAASKHLLGILNDVLDMSKIESGKFLLAEEKFGLGVAMNEVAVIIKQRCADKRLIFADNIGEIPDISVVGDKLRLKQVLINLLGNAVKFTPENGEIRFLVDVRKREAGMVAVKFSVKDTGIGISAAQRSKLFSAFEQADSTIAVQFGGTGLGLAISQNLVGLMNGKIVVESELGKGSTFSFSLPMAFSEGVVDSAAPVNVETPNLRNRRMLLAEDIEINRLIIRELLADTQIEIDEAEDGQLAVEMFQASSHQHYDIIFMDVQMPRMNGYDATRAIRTLDRPDAANVQIVAMTAHAYKDDIQRALDAGMNAHLTKPIDISMMMQLLATRLGND